MERHDRKEVPALEAGGFLRLWVGLALLAALVAVLGTALFLRREYARNLGAWRERLSVLAESRENLAGHLLADGQEDLAVLRDYPTLRVLAGGELPPPPRAPYPLAEGPRAHVETLLGSFVRNRGYAGAYLLDGRGRTVAASPGAPPLPEACRSWLGDPLSRSVPCRFLPREGGGAWLVHAAPAGPARAGEAPPGLFLLEDPGRRFYRLLLALPYPTRTGEILLAEEAGGRLCFLTPLRFSSAPPLSQSVADLPGLAAGEALRRGSAFGTFTDYRGRAVLAAVRRLPGPGWALVVKVDREEALGAFRTEVLPASLVAALLLAFLASALVSYRRRIRAQKALQERDGLLRQEEALARLNRFYRTLSRVNETLVRADDPEALLHDVCRVLVETGGFSLAWIGEAEEGGRVAVRASAGDAFGYLEGICVRCDDTPEGRGPCGTAYREGRAVVISDWSEDPRSSPWREKGLSAGIGCGASFPMRHAGKTWGILNLYTPEKGAFDEERLRLGQELADDLAFALRGLEDRRNLKETLARLAEAKKLETIGLITGGVAHEVRNPLFAISTVLAGLERKLGKNEEYAEFFFHLNDQVKRLKELMDDLLSLGRPIETKDFQKVDGRALLERAVADLAPAFPGAPERVILPPGGDGFFLWGAEAKLRQVFQNLLSNALSFTPEGGKVRVEARQEGDLVRFDVRDEGPGIAPALLENLFTPFVSKRKGGTGLGLAIVKKIVEAHGGSVEARNNDPPPGATFTVRLPAHPPRDAAGDGPGP